MSLKWHQKYFFKIAIATLSTFQSVIRDIDGFLQYSLCLKFDFLLNLEMSHCFISFIALLRIEFKFESLHTMLT